MSIGKLAAKKKRNESFLQLNSNGTFVTWGSAKTTPIDSNLQRKQLHSDPSIQLPITGVLKMLSNGEIYLVGISISNVDGEDNYDRVTLLHKISSNLGGLVEYFNYKQGASAPAVYTLTDLGKRSEGNFYVTLSYVSSNNGIYQYKVYASSETPLAKDGIFTLGSINYKVISSYEESGFSCADVVVIDDNIEAITYRHIDNLTSGYNLTSGTLSMLPLDHVFPGIVGSREGKERSEDSFEVIIRVTSLPTKVIAGNTLLLVDGTVAKIVSVKDELLNKGQLLLTCIGK